MMLHNVLRCIDFVSTLIATHCDTRKDSDSILTFPCVKFLHLIAKKLLIIKFLHFAN